jgi:probable rRNA maturation factor
MITVFNKEKLKEFPIDKVIKLLNREFSFDRKVNIIFVDEDKIKEFNKEYREKDEVTDVLSFNIDSDDTFGEIYICPEYVIKNFNEDKYIEEIIRLLIHGVLHLKGYEHKSKFDEVDYKDEPMYIKQEELVNKFLKEMIQK